jgi:hypothetical protein
MDANTSQFPPFLSDPHLFSIKESAKRSAPKLNRSRLPRLRLRFRLLSFLSHLATYALTGS